MSKYKLEERSNADIICGMLGVELDKPFNVEGLYFNPYVIKEDGAYDCQGDLENGFIGDLLFGMLEIERINEYKEITFKQAIKIMVVDDGMVYFDLDDYHGDKHIEKNELRNRNDREGFIDEDFDVWWIDELLDARFYIKEGE